jgi:predicted NBD/HSP70 family sugar kinase
VKHILGLELLDNRALAVAIDETGRVLGRASVASADLGAAALATLDGAAAGSAGSIGGIGVASMTPESPECTAALTAIATRYPGSFLKDGAFASGTAAVVAETWIGAARDARDVVYFAVGDHTSAGIVRDGAPLNGPHRRAPAVAWLALNPVEREDYRKTGCLEAEVAAAGIIRRLVWRIKAGDRSRVQDVVNGDFAAITTSHILDAARAGDGVSISVVRDTAKYLGMAAANLVVIADPAVLVLGGIMASAADLLLDPVRVEITRRVPPGMMATLTIVPAALGADAAALGAARLAAAAVE